MKLSSILTTRFVLFTSAFIFGAPPVYAQVTPGPGGSIVGQPPGQGSSQRNGSIIGQPPPAPGGSMPGPSSTGQSGGSTLPPLAPGQIGPVQPSYPSGGSTGGRDPVKERLNRTTREGADLDRNGIISPEEASRIPPGTPLPR